MGLPDILLANKQKQNEKLLELIVSNSIDLIALLDINGTYLYVSPSHKPILGYSSNDLVGKKLRSIVHPDDLPALLADKEKALHGEYAENLEFRIRHRNGNWIIAEGSAQAIVDEKGIPNLIVAKARDITERNEMEKNITFLSEASKVFASSLDYEKTLQNIARLASLHIAEWNVIDLLTEDKKIDMVYLWHADEAKQKLGIAYRKKYPRSIDTPFGVGKAIRTGKTQLDYFEGNNKLYSLTKEKAYKRVNKQLHITTQLCVPLKIHGNVIGAITFSSSIPNKRFSKNEILVAQELASRAALAIENARLYKEAQQVIASKDDFIAMASHELKTPITSVSIYAHVLQNKFFQKDKATYMQITKMNGQLQQVTNLINELLELSRMQHKRLTYHKTAFAIYPFVKEIISTMQQTTSAHAIVLNGTTKKKIYGDKDRIGQVLINLLSNAIKYSKHAKKIVVTMQTTKNTIIIGIQDFGIGIAKEHQTKIFERFYQVTESVEKTFPGLGIGLYLCAEIIKEHGGKIWVESKKGKGSTFYFTLPLRK